MPESRPRAGEQGSLGGLIQTEGIGAKVAERSVADNVLEIAGDLGGGLVVQRLLKHVFAGQKTEGFEQQGDRLVPANRGVEFAQRVEEQRGVEAAGCIDYAGIELEQPPIHARTGGKRLVAKAPAIVSQVGACQ